MGFPSTKALWRNVYGECQMAAEVDLSGPLGSMAARMPDSGSDFDTSLLLRKHTLFPYLTFSMPPQRQQEVEAKLICRGPRPAGSVLGTANWAVKSPTYLRYCRSCVREDKNGPVGVPYWRRSHQLPGVIICPLHQETLIASTLLRAFGAGRTGFISLERALELGGETEVLPSQFSAPALQIARDSLWLLQNPDMGDGTLSERHREWQFAHGWQCEKGSHRGKLTFTDFLSAIRDYYSEEFLRTLSEGKDSLLISKTGGWIRELTLLQNKDRAYHPLQHILLWQFLALTAEKFFQDPGEPIIMPEPDKSSQPLTLEGPCPNVACSQYDPPVPRILDVQEEKKGEISTIACPVCDFTYTQRPNCDTSKNIRIKRTGKIWNRRIEKLLNRSPKITLKEIANKLGFEPKTIQKHALRLNLWRPEWKESRKQTVSSANRYQRKRENARDRNRQKWLRLRSEFPGESRTELWKREPSVADYLRINDKDWYNVHSPKIRENWKKEARIKWQVIDKSTLSAAKEKVSEMLKENPPVRITLHGLSVRLGQTSTLRSRIRRNKLPQTAEFIDQAAEGRRDYALRRLRNTVGHYAQQKELPAITEFLVRASMGHLYYPELATEAYAALTAHIEHKEPIPSRWNASNPKILREA